MTDILFVVAGVAIFTMFMFAVLVFSMHGAHARVRFEKIKRELKEQGRYEEWARENKVLLLTQLVAKAGAWLGLPCFLFFIWLGSQQLGLVFLYIFVISLAVLLPLIRFLYNNISEDQK